MITCTLKNQSSHTLRVTFFRGDDWVNQNRYEGLELPPNARAVVVGELDPASPADEHWGWIYVEDLDMKLSLQLYVRVDAAGRVADRQLGVKCGVSSRDLPNPAPWPRATSITDDMYVYQTA